MGYGVPLCAAMLFRIFSDRDGFCKVVPQVHLAATMSPHPPESSYA
jgi:hypothetical protein